MFFDVPDLDTRSFSIYNRPKIREGKGQIMKRRVPMNVEQRKISACSMPCSAAVLCAVRLFDALRFCFFSFIFTPFPI